MPSNLNSAGREPGKTAKAEQERKDRNQKADLRATMRDRRAV